MRILHTVLILILLPACSAPATQRTPIAQATATSQPTATIPATQAPVPTATIAPTLVATTPRPALDADPLILWAVGPESQREALTKLLQQTASTAGIPVQIVAKSPNALATDITAGSLLGPPPDMIWGGADDLFLLKQAGIIQPANDRLDDRRWRRDLGDRPRRRLDPRHLNPSREKWDQIHAEPEFRHVNRLRLVRGHGLKVIRGQTEAESDQPKLEPPDRDPVSGGLADLPLQWSAQRIDRKKEEQRAEEHDDAQKDADNPFPPRVRRSAGGGLRGRGTGHEDVRVSPRRRRAPSIPSIPCRDRSR